MVHFLLLRMSCAKFDWNRPTGSAEERLFYFLSPYLSLDNVIDFNWTKVDSIQQKMLGRNGSIGSRDSDF